MRELTGDTRIRIKRPRPELTGDTRIRLSQIKDLAAWIEDRRYEIGEISQKTGLLKTANGWIVPPHSIINMEQPGERRSEIGGGSGTEKPWYSYKAHELKEHLLPKVKETFSPAKIKQLLHFQKNKKKVVVDTGSGPKTMEVPAAFLQDPRTQKLNTKEYQELTKDLKDQINYLHYFDFKGKTDKEASDSLQLMGFVNACAFKGRPKKELTRKENIINEIIYDHVKSKYVPKAVKYYMSKNARVRYDPDPDEDLIYITNPYTRVQVSFHGYKPEPGMEIPKAAPNEWNHVEHSYIFKDPKEMERFEKLRDRIRKTVKDSESLIDSEKDFIMQEPGGSKMTYGVLYEDGELVEREYKDDEAARAHLQRNKEHGSMKIVKITNYKTNQEIKL